MLIYPGLSVFIRGDKMKNVFFFTFYKSRNSTKARETATKPPLLLCGITDLRTYVTFPRLFVRLFCVHQGGPRRLPPPVPRTMNTTPPRPLRGRGLPPPPPPPLPLPRCPPLNPRRRRPCRSTSKGWTATDVSVLLLVAAPIRKCVFGLTAAPVADASLAQACRGR